jgi:hypothetical protein
LGLSRLVKLRGLDHIYSWECPGYHPWLALFENCSLEADG